MRTSPIALFTTVAVIAAVGVLGLAAARARNTQVMTLRLADGSVEQIRYTGGTPPQVRLMADPTSSAALEPIVVPVLGPGSTFDDLDRLSAAMDRQAESMIQEANDTAASALNDGRGLMTTDLQPATAGVREYSISSTISSNGVCTRNVQYRSFSDGGKPQVVTRTSGRCEKVWGQEPASVSATTASPDRGGPMIQASFRSADRS